jgi:hypothetical protein
MAEFAVGSGADLICAIIGGNVFQGRDIPLLVGAYVYADWCSGKIFGLWHDGYSVHKQILVVTDLTITSFGQDLAGNIYLLSSDSHVGLHPIFRMVAKNSLTTGSSGPTYQATECKTLEIRL